MESEDCQCGREEICKKQNEVIEALMQGYVDGKIQISKKVIYEIQQKD